MAMVWKVCGTPIWTPSGSGCSCSATARIQCGYGGVFVRCRPSQLADAERSIRCGCVEGLCASREA